MKIFRLAVLAALLCAALAAQPQPLRIFIRSSEKTHGAPDNGNHDYPAFLAGWKQLLTARGATVEGAPRFPTADELARTDVLIDYASDGANVSAAERAVLDQYLKRGGGVVVIHDGMCGGDAAWFSTVAGGAKQHGERNSSAGKIKLHLEDPSHPILAGMSDLDLDDEMFYLLRAAPEMHVLATTPDPTGKIVPQLWTYEKTLPGGQPYRAFVTLQGHRYSNFEQPAYQTILLRGIAWAGKRPLDTLIVGATMSAGAQPRRGGRGPQGPVVVSPELHPDRHVTFRILAPQAQNVRLTGGDIPGNGQGKVMTKGADGVWEVTIGPIDPGAYRYNLNVDGVAVIDPRNPSISESNNNVWSLVYIPGADFMDTKDVPHGAVAAVTYYSTTLKKFRRMHVYTPPGYELGQGKFPIFYLLHGAGDCDEAWTSVGRAGFILDNLIAARKAKPMVVVMPAGHTSQTFGGRGGGGRGTGAPDEFVQEFVSDIMLYAEAHYRVHTDRQHRAIAGLSMGGNQTLNISIPHLERFAYIGVYSSGLIGAFGGGRGPGAGAAAPPPTPPGPTWEEQHKLDLDNAAAKRGLKLLWFSTGKEDGLLATTQATVDLLKKHGFSPIFEESSGAHTWINWRNYLNQFAPQLFQ